MLCFLSVWGFGSSLFVYSLRTHSARALSRLLNTHRSLPFKCETKSCATVEPHAQLVAMVTYNNAAGSQSPLLVHHDLNALQTLHKNEGCRKNGSLGFQKVDPPAPFTSSVQTHSRTGAAEHVFFNLLT